MYNQRTVQQAAVPRESIALHTITNKLGQQMTNYKDLQCVDQQVLATKSTNNAV